MHEQRRIRFADISGLQREDLPIACEVWLDDLFRASWGTREAGKLGTYLTRYIQGTHGAKASLRRIENQCQLSRDTIRQTLVLLRAYAAIDEFNIEEDDLSVSLSLSFLQRLRALEVAQRFGHLIAERQASRGPWQPPQAAVWQPPAATVIAEAAASAA